MPLRQSLDPQRSFRGGTLCSAVMLPTSRNSLRAIRSLSLSQAPLGSVEPPKHVIHGLLGEVTITLPPDEVRKNAYVQLRSGSPHLK
jgi:hypothetical protein